MHGVQGRCSRAGKKTQTGVCACVRATSGIVGELQGRSRDAESRSFCPLQLFTRAPHSDGNTLHSAPLPTCKLDVVLFRSRAASNDFSLSLFLCVVTETRGKDFTSWTLNRLPWIYPLKRTSSLIPPSLLPVLQLFEGFTAVRLCMGTTEGGRRWVEVEAHAWRRYAGMLFL